ncbi:hypothetical protein BDC45DRAFT_535583 [Circinella umbellata]|nr:hypothetical protein BDC45DRAFT_535583 [Circinella umbellata]
MVMIQGLIINYYFIYYYEEEDDDDEDEDEDEDEVEVENGESDDDEKKEDMDVNATLSELGFKKLAGKLKESDLLVLLSSLKVQGDRIEQQIHKQIIYILSQVKMTDLEKEILKLLLSKVINCLDSTILPSVTDLTGLVYNTIYAKMKELFSCSQLNYLIGKKQEFISMNLMTFIMFNTLLNKDCVEYFGIEINPTASKTMYYRRFALILDFVFKGLEVGMKDGEAVAEVTKMAIEQNSFDDTNSFRRKIDVLINKAIKTNHFKLKQQSKNIRSNCVILNNLYILTSGQVSSIIALDMIGKIGYLYLL